MSPTDRYDVVIIGAGPAGLSAALLLGRARRRTIVVDSGEPRNARADHLHGYLTRDGIPPSQFIDLARAEVRGYGVELIEGTVTSIFADRRVVLDDGRDLSGRQVVLACGLKDVLPEIPGASERWGRDLLHCPYCHGWEVRDRALAVLGTGETSIQQAQLVRQFSTNVTLFLHELKDLHDDDARSLTALGVEVVPGTVQSLDIRNDALAGVRLQDGRSHPCEVLFYEPGSTVDTSIVKTPTCANPDDGCISADGDGRTSVDGVWVVGNAADPAAQVIVAAGDAYRVAVSVNASLLEDDVALARAQQEGGI